ncbi:hypothetical protein [Nonomuraea cypriaca]|uniref:hypothetical protein n=1 Tax=Nonomuraea cypriaca TaxID=1187855 RepID=UPI0038B34F97
MVSEILDVPYQARNSRSHGEPPLNLGGLRVAGALLMITKLTEQWKAEQRAFPGRDLSTDAKS